MINEYQQVNVKLKLVNKNQKKPDSRPAFNLNLLIYENNYSKSLLSSGTNSATSSYVEITTSLYSSKNFHFEPSP